MANPFMVKGNRLAVGRRNPKKNEIVQMLDQFVPKVIEIIAERLNNGDAIDRWQTAQALMPYLFSKKPNVVKNIETKEAMDKEALDLKQYLLKRTRYGLDKTS